MTPRSRKSGYGLLLGCRSQLDAGPFEELFFDDVRKMNVPKIGKVITVRFGPASQLIGRGRLSREGALDVRESRERRDKIVPKSSPEKQEKRNFGLIFSTFLSRIACCARESTSAWQNLRQKKPKKKKKNWISEICFYKWPAHPVFSGEFSFFWPRKNQLLGGV